MRIYLVRQAETLGNKEGRYGGYNPELATFTKRGEEQKQQLREFFSDKQIYEVFCSPKNTCYATAQAIKSYLFATVMQLEDIEMGIFSGKTKEEIETSAPEELQRRAENVYMYQYPGGESYKVCEERVMKWFNAVQWLPDKEYCIVSHLTPIQLILKHLIGKDFSELKHLFLAPGSISVVHKEGTKWVVDDLNKQLVDTSDLKEHMNALE
ncbi:histidine phosphatase family protein [Candidatus Woesearchaeota archaeon]|nr:histidine phosphatase family protein [Candidatus Woesearchaeota archaeon]